MHPASAEEVGGLGVFLYEAAQNFDQNLKFRNLAVDTLYPIHCYHRGLIKSGQMLTLKEKQ